MLIKRSQLRKIIQEIYSNNGFDKIPIELDWVEDDEPSRASFPTRMMIPEYLVEKLKETKDPAAYQDIVDYVLRQVFKDRWKDPSWVRKFSWDFHPSTGLMLHGLEVLEITSESDY